MTYFPAGNKNIPYPSDCFSNLKHKVVSDFDFDFME